MPSSTTPNRLIDTSTTDHSVWDDQGLFFSIGVSLLVSVIVIAALSVVKILIVARTSVNGRSRDVALARLFRPKHLTTPFDQDGAPVELRQTTRSSMLGGLPRNLLKNWLSIGNVDEAPNNQYDYFVSDILKDAVDGQDGGAAEGTTAPSRSTTSRTVKSQQQQPVLGEAYYVRITTAPAAATNSPTTAAATTPAPTSTSRRSASPEASPLPPIQEETATSQQQPVSVSSRSIRGGGGKGAAGRSVTWMRQFGPRALLPFNTNPLTGLLTLDPNVEVFMFYCRMCIALFFVASMVTVMWVSVVAGVDKYYSNYNVRTGAYMCRKQDDVSDCEKNMHCRWGVVGSYNCTSDDGTGGIINSTECSNSNSTNPYPSAFGCFPVAVDGLYDLSVQNLYPILPLDDPMYDPHVPYELKASSSSSSTSFSEALYVLRDSVVDGLSGVGSSVIFGLGSLSNGTVPFIPGTMTLPRSAPAVGESRGRLIAVAILALAYGVLFAGIVVKSLRGVNGYVMKVMRIQSRNSLGYRTVLIRGVPERLLPGTAQLQLKLLDSESSSDSQNDGDDMNDAASGRASFDPVLGLNVDRTVSGPHLTKGGTKRFWRRYLSVGGLCVGGGRSARRTVISDGSERMTAYLPHELLGSWAPPRKVPTTTLSIFDGTPDSLRTWKSFRATSRPSPQPSRLEDADNENSPREGGDDDNAAAATVPTSIHTAATFSRLKNAFLTKSVSAVIPSTVVSHGLRKEYEKFIEAKQNLEDAIGEERTYHRELQSAALSATTSSSSSSAAVDANGNIVKKNDVENGSGVEEPLLSKTPLMGRILPKIWKKVPVVATRKEMLREATEKLNNKIMSERAARLENEKNEVLSKKASIKNGGGQHHQHTPSSLDAVMPSEDDDQHFRRHIQHSGGVFVVFKDAQCAFEYVEVFNNQYGGLLSNQRASIAGPPSEVVDTVLGNNKFVSALICTALITGFVWLIFFWSIPVAFLGSLSQLSTLPGIGKPIGDFVNTIPLGLRNILQAYLPVIVLTLFGMFLPDVARKIVSVGGVPTKAATDYYQAMLMFSFSFINGVVLQAALQGGLAQLAALIKEPSEQSAATFIVAIISPQGGYWYASVVSGYMGQWLNVALLSPMILMKTFVSRVGTQRAYDDLFKTWDAAFHMMFTSLMVSTGMGVLFHFSVPLLGLFVGLFFICAYFSHRGLLLDNYVPKLNPTTQMVSSFRLLATSLRLLCVLYCVAAIGAVMVCSLKNSPGAASVASIAVVIGASVALYCFFITSRWIPTLPMVKQWMLVDFDNISEVTRSDGCIATTATNSRGVLTNNLTNLTSGSGLGDSMNTVEGGGSTVAPPSPSSSQVAVLSTSSAEKSLSPSYTPEAATKRLKAAFPLNCPSDYFSTAESIFPVNDVDLLIMEAEGRNYSIVRYWHGDVAMDDVVAVPNLISARDIILGDASSPSPQRGGDSDDEEEEGRGGGGRDAASMQSSICPRMIILNNIMRERQDAGQNQFGGDTNAVGAKPLVHYELRRDVLNQSWTEDGEDGEDAPPARDGDELNVNSDNESDMPMSFHYAVRAESQAMFGGGGGEDDVGAESLYAESFHLPSVSSRATSRAKPT